MTCPVCGANNEGGAAFCFRCGTPLKSSTPAATGPTVSLNRSDPGQSSQPFSPAPEESHVRVYDTPPASNTGGQPYGGPTESAPYYSMPGQGSTATYGVTSNTALIALILGIVSFVLGLSIIAAIPAVIVGRNARKEIQASGGRLTGEGMAQAGIILGWINIAITVLGFCFVCASLTILGSADF